MTTMRISPVVFTALPAQYWAHNLSIVDYVFNSLIALLGAFTKFLNQSISFFFVSA